MKQKNRRVVCADGFNMSVQADENSYCSPRTDEGPYLSVEVGFPSAYDFYLIEYAEDRNQPTETVYGWVPIRQVRLCIDAHGGWAEGELPPFDTEATGLEWPDPLPAQ
jgi:hypothetical protein